MEFGPLGYVFVYAVLGAFLAAMMIVVLIVQAIDRLGASWDRGLRNPIHRWARRRWDRRDNAAKPGPDGPF